MSSSKQARPTALKQGPLSWSSVSRYQYLDHETIPSSGKLPAKQYFKRPIERFQL